MFLTALLQFNYEELSFLVKFMELFWSNFQNNQLFPYKKHIGYVKRQLKI